MGANTNVMVLNNLIRICILGPAVSLNGSPTVSPTIVALCTSVPLPPTAPLSTYFLALSQAPPALFMNIAIRMPVDVENIRYEQIHYNL